MHSDLMGGRTRLLYVHASEDEALRRALEAHLSSLQQEGCIDGWHVGLLLAGATVDRQLTAEVARADLVLLLLSSDFMASRQCQALLAQVRQESAARHLAVVPVLARPVDLHGTVLEGLQVLPRNGQAVTLWPNQDTAWLEVAIALRALLTLPHEKGANKAPPKDPAAPSQPAPDAYVRLVELIKAMFTAPDLRLFIRALPGGEEILDGMPGPDAPPALQISAAIEAWLLHGMVDDSLFDRLLAARQRQRERILQARQAVLGGS